MSGLLEGQVAIVTGAGRGFGRAIAERFAAEGARVALTQRSAAEIEAVAASLPAGSGIALPGDVTDAAHARRVVEETERRLGPVTVLVNNAGIPGPFGPVWEVDAEDWWRTQEVHVRGAFLFAHAVLPGMIDRETGRIINMVSSAGRKPSTNFSGYSLAKASQIHLTEFIAAETEPHGVQAFALQPGTVATDFVRSIIGSEEAQRWLPRLVDHLDRIERTSDAEAALRLCADACVNLATGRYAALSGRYLEASWSLDELLAGEGV